MNEKDFNLRGFRSSDIPSLARYANNRNVWLNVRDVFPHPYTEENARWFIEDFLPQAAGKIFAIEVGGEAAGSIGIKFKEDVYRLNAEIGFWLGEPFWGRGIATRAVGQVIEYVAGHHPEIIRLYAQVYDHNLASPRVLLKNGFAREATLRRAVIKDGKIEDLHIFSRLMGDN